jgi:uncharacterized protein (TIGR02598 family)
MKMVFPARRTAGNGKVAAFSLVEVTIAIGIFAFVVVGILGLLPTAMKMRAESAQETRAAIIAQELFSSVAASPSITNVRVRTGATVSEGDVRYNQDLRGVSVVVGYPSGTTVPFWFYESPDAAWVNSGAGNSEIQKSARINDIQTIARLQASNVSGFPNLYALTVEVRSPAAASLENCTPTVFQTLFYSNP